MKSKKESSPLLRIKSANPLERSDIMSQSERNMSHNASFGMNFKNQKFSYDVQSKLDVLEEFEDFDQVPVNDSSNLIKLYPTGQ